MSQWKKYEEVAQHLLNEFASALGLSSVEAKQHVRGQSGTSWEIDAKGFREGDTGFVIVECRRYSTSKIRQDEVASLAYRIKDTGAAGGIIVSPLALQKGAEKVAAAENIVHVILMSESTTNEYIVAFLSSVLLGLSDEAKVNFTEHASVRKYDESGTVVDDR